MLTLLVASAAVVAAAVAARRDGGSAASAVASPSSLPRAVTGGRSPWPANTAQLAERLRALGLPALEREGTVLHLHQHLDLYVSGRRVVVPAGIGIDPNGTFISPLHTHDESGVVHVESPTVREFTLGELFGVWGVPLTKSCLGGDCAGGGKRVWVFVDGRPFAGDPGSVALREHEEIVVAYGTRAQLPQPLPAAYDFAPGL